MLVGGIESYKAVDDVSAINRVYTATDSLGRSYALLGDSAASNNLDFTASTIAVSTQCTPISKKCRLQGVDSPVTYHCSDQFQGDLSIKLISNASNAGVTWRMNFFNDSQFNQPTEFEGDVRGANPVYIGIGAYVNDLSLTIAANGSSQEFVPPSPSAGNNDTDIVRGDNGGLDSRSSSSAIPPCTTPRTLGRMGPSPNLYNSRSRTGVLPASSRDHNRTTQRSDCLTSCLAQSTPCSVQLHKTWPIKWPYCTVEQPSASSPAYSPLHKTS
jgi:hypothetical protein